jgi:hypothetical protein
MFSLPQLDLPSFHNMLRRSVTGEEHPQTGKHPEMSFDRTLQAYWKLMVVRDSASFIHGVAPLLNVGFAR